MAKDKYDIPYAMKPKGKGKGKGSKYSSYLENQSKGLFKGLSADAKKLVIYVTFFSLFAYIFLTALRSSKVPETGDYQLDLGHFDSRERNLIDDSLDPTDFNYDLEQEQSDSNEQEDNVVNEIDVLDSDANELSGEMERKSIKKAQKGTKDPKAKIKANTKGKADKSSEFEAESDELEENAKKQLNQQKNSAGRKKASDQKDTDDATNVKKSEKIKGSVEEKSQNANKKGKKY